MPIVSRSRPIDVPFRHGDPRLPATAGAGGSPARFHRRTHVGCDNAPDGRYTGGEARIGPAEGNRPMTRGARLWKAARDGALALLGVAALGLAAFFIWHEPGERPVRLRMTAGQSGGARQRLA